MGNNEPAGGKIARLMEQQGRTYVWLAVTTGIPYKRLLAEVKNQTRPMSLDTALATAEALGVDLPALVAA
ncbi:helix-turn-helix transcriptional regulator [Microbacterium sp. A8/3-1]|uniref:Helix-turn-helix transcriptional regulator n=1 Tax=Microbacterium sp. A8/3-1 TaxID=3160749 RepID=A0AAU7VWW1_9MICO